MACESRQPKDRHLSSRQTKNPLKQSKQPAVQLLPVGDGAFTARTNDPTAVGGEIGGPCPVHPDPALDAGKQFRQIAAFLSRSSSNDRKASSRRAVLSSTRTPASRSNSSRCGSCSSNSRLTSSAE